MEEEAGKIGVTAEVEEEETSHGKAEVAGMMVKTGMVGMIPQVVVRMRPTPDGTVTAGGARDAIRRLT